MPDDARLNLKIHGAVHGGLVLIGQGNQVILYDGPTAHSITEASPLLPNPYCGLATFRAQDCNNFFGREALTTKLGDRLRALAASPGGGPRLLLLLGASGCGKSSVLRAGLIPELAARPLGGQRSTRIVVFTPGRHPLEALAGALAQLQTDDPWPVARAVELARELVAWGETPSPQSLLPLSPDAVAGPAAPLLLVVDQLEELYTLCDRAKERDVFLAYLLRAAEAENGRVSVVMALPTEFLNEVQNHAVLSSLLNDHAVLLPTMTMAELRRVICEPAKRAGKALELALVELLLSQAQEHDGALPLLQFTLQQLWEAEDPVQALAELGGVGGSLASRGQALLDALPDESCRAIAQRALVALLDYKEGSGYSRRRVLVADLVAHHEDDEGVRKVLRAFAQPHARLLTLSATEGQQWVELTHEALWRHWQKLQGWLAAAQQDRPLGLRLQQAARHWSEARHPPGLLFRTPELEVMQDYASRASHDLTALQLNFLAASVALQRSECVAADRRSAAERRAARFFRGTAIVSMSFILAAFFAGARSLKERKVAQDGLLSLFREQARRELFSADSGPSLDGIHHDGARALVYLGAAYHRGDRSPEVRALLRAALRPYSSPLLSLDGSHGISTAADKDVSGSALLLASRDGTARVWDTSDGKQIASLDFLKHDLPVTHAAISPNATAVVTTSADRIAKVWVCNELLCMPRLQLPHDEAVQFAEFSPDSSSLVTAGADGTARLWRVDLAGQVMAVGQALQFFSSFGADTSQNGALLRVLGGHRGAVNTARFDPDGARIVTASADGSARVWDAKTGRVLTTMVGHRGGVLSARFSPDGARVLTVSIDWTARLWDAASGKEVHTWTSQAGESRIAMAEFSPDGELVVTAGAGVVQVWSTESFQLVSTINGHTNAVRSLALSPDGMQLVTAGMDRTAKVWDAYTGELLASLEGHTAPIFWVGVTADGTRVLTASQDGTAKVWAIRDLRGLPILKGHHGPISAVAYSPDGAQLATSGSDKRIRLWKAQDGTPLRSFQHTAWLTDLAFSPDGSRLLTTDSDGMAMLWDVATGDERVAVSSQRVARASFSLDGARIATAGEDGVARMYERQGELVNERLVLPGHAGKVSSATFSPDGGRILTSGQDGTARIWEASTGKPVLVVQAHGQVVQDARFSPDGRRFLTTSDDGTAKLWDAVRGELLATLQGHVGRVWRAAYSPDGSFILTAGFDGTIRLWEAERGKPVDVLRGHGDSVLGAVFDPSGGRLASAGRDGVARVFEVGLETRTPAQVAALLRCHIPWRMSDGQLVPTVPEASSCASPLSVQTVRDRLRPIAAANLMAMGLQIASRGRTPAIAWNYLEAARTEYQKFETSGEHEVLLQSMLGGIAAQSGHLDVGRTRLNQALTQLRATGGSAETEANLILSLGGVAMMAYGQDPSKIQELAAARDHFEELLRLLESQPDPKLALQAHFGLGIVYFHLGQVPTALAHLDWSFQRSQDPATTVHRALCLFALGEVAASLENARQLRKGQAEGSVQGNPLGTLPWGDRALVLLLGWAAAQLKGLPAEADFYRDALRGSPLGDSPISSDLRQVATILLRVLPGTTAKTERLESVLAVFRLISSSGGQVPAVPFNRLLANSW